MGGSANNCAATLQVGMLSFNSPLKELAFNCPIFNVLTLGGLLVDTFNNEQHAFGRSHVRTVIYYSSEDLLGLVILYQCLVLIFASFLHFFR